MTSNRFMMGMCLMSLLCGSGCERKPQPKAPADEQAAMGEEKPANSAAEIKATEDTAAAKAANPLAAKASGSVESAEDKLVAARFGDKKVFSQEEVFQRIKLLPESVQKRLPLSQLYNLVLFVMIQEKLAFDAAIEEGVDRREDVQKQLASLQENIVQQHLLDAEGEKGVTSEAIEKQYAALTAGFKSEPEIGLQHILVGSEAEAKAVFDQLKAGASFEDLQVKRSKDRRTLEKKGFLGFFRKGQLPKAEADLIMQAKPGEVISRAVAVPGTGFSVLRVTEIRQSKPAPLERVRSRVRNVVFKRASLEYIGKLYGAYKVTLLNPDGSKRAYQTVDERLAALREHKTDVESDQKRENSLEKLKDDSVVARIGEGKEAQEVTFAQISAFIKDNPTMFRGLSPYEVFTTATEEYVNKNILKAEAEKQKISELKEVADRWTDARRSFLAQQYLNEHAKAMITKERIQKEYDALMAKFDKNEMEYSIRVIPTESREKGQSAIKALTQGKKFDQVMDDFCSDQRFRDNKGDFGYLRSAQLKRLAPKLQESVARAAAGTVLTTPVEVQGQFWVVRVQDKRAIELPTLQQSKDVVTKRLFPECMVKVTMKLIADHPLSAYDFAGKPLDLTEAELERSLGSAPIAPAA